MSQAYDDELDTVSQTGQHRFGLGQPVWTYWGNQRAYIVVNYVKGRFLELVLESDPTGQLYLAHEDYLTDQPPSAPSMHLGHRGRFYSTSTGWPLKSIPNQWYKSC